MIGRESLLELKSPAECTKGERDRFRLLVLKAGEVQQRRFDDRLAMAKVLAFLRVDAAIIGVGALKIPNEQYVQKIFKTAGSQNEARSM